MLSGPIPSNEKERLKSLANYQVLDSISELEFDELTKLASQICGTKIALISLIDENRQWFKSKVGIEASETSREISFCAHAINDPKVPLIIEDSRLDDRFRDNPLVTGDPNVIFYAGVPLVNKDDMPLGTLCVIDDKPRKLTEEQIFGLKTITKSVMNLLESRKKNFQLEHEKILLIDSLEYLNPLFFILDKDRIIQNYGVKLLKVQPSLKEKTDFSEYFEFLAPFDWNQWIQDDEIIQNKLYFFQSLDTSQRFKFSIKKHGRSLIISASPIVNTNFPLNHYHLTINDFSKHDYIAEFLFLQQTTERSLLDSKNLLLKTQEKNIALQRANEQVDLLARFPAENPNPIIRLNKELSISYINDAAKLKFTIDFNLTETGIGDEELRGYLTQMLQQGQDVLKLILKRNKRHYNISLRNVPDQGYLNIYAIDITNYIEQVQQKETELVELNTKIQSQKEFYEFVLNTIPSDIAVFSREHKYVFINPQGIKNQEIREFMIGKDDFDYCQLKGISTDLAENRRKVFNEVIASGESRDWIDDKIDGQGNRVVIYRVIAPLKDERGEIMYVVGYGLDITPTKIVEERLIQSNKRLLLLENFLNKTTDAIQVSDEFGNMVYVNQTASERLGIQIEDIKKYRVSDFEKYFNDEIVWRDHIEFLKEHGVFNVESVNINQATGEKYDVEVNVVYEEIDGLGYSIAASRDITQRRKTQEELRSLSLVAKNTTNGVLILNKERKIIWVNEAILNRSEYTFDELFGKSPSVFQYDGSNQDTVNRIIQGLSDKNAIEEEILHVSKSGNLYWINLNMQPIFDDKDEFEGYIAIELDITERKKFEQTIATQNKDLKEITDALDQSALVSIADSKGLIIKANQKFCDVSGYLENELLGKNHSLLNSNFHSSEFWINMWKTVMSGEIWRAEVCNKRKNGELYWVDSIIYPVFDVNGEIRQYLSIRHEITDRKFAVNELERKAALQRLLVKISSEYINIPLSTVDSSINKSMAEIGVFVKVDRVYIFDYNHESETASNLYEWCEFGIKPQIENLQHIPFSEIPFWVSTHFAGEPIIVSNTKEIAPSPFREMIEVQDIKSLVAIPMMDNNKCIGFVGFDAVRSIRVFSEEEQNLLELYSQMLVNVSQRTDYLKQIQQSKNDIEEINRGLELQVQEKTITNLELAKSLSDQEKMVTIGEVSSGIAHDLNTPLGAIKSGAENIRFTLEALFHDTIWRCSPDQIRFACERASSTEIELFLGGMQQRKETEAFSLYLRETFPTLEDEKIISYSNGLVKNRIKIQDTELIANIVSSENAQEFIDLIYHMQMTRNFVDTILSSGERASQVINDLRSFIKDNKSSDKIEVILQNNIATVLTIFNYELKIDKPLK